MQPNSERIGRIIAVKDHGVFPGRNQAQFFGAESLKNALIPGCTMALGQAKDILDVTAEKARMRRASRDIPPGIAGPDHCFMLPYRKHLAQEMHPAMLPTGIAERGGPR